MSFDFRDVDMKKFIKPFLVFVLLTFSIINTVFAQTMQTYSSPEYNIKFSVPSIWITSTGIENDVPFLESQSPEKQIDLFVFVYKDSKISTRELLYATIKEFDVTLNPDVVKHESLNGLDAYYGDFYGTWRGTKVGIIILAAKYEDNNYIAYIETDEKDFDKNGVLMDKIIDSFAPVKK